MLAKAIDSLRQVAVAVNLQGLRDGTVDLVIANPVDAMARTLTRAMALAVSGQERQAATYDIAFELITPENL